MAGARRCNVDDGLDFLVGPPAKHEAAAERR